MLPISPAPSPVPVAPSPADDVPDELEPAARKQVNELATAAEAPGVDEGKVAEAILEKVKAEKERKQFEEGIKGQAAVAAQEMKEKDAEKKLAAAQAGVDKEKERQLKRIEEIEEEKQAEINMKKKRAMQDAIAEKNKARQEAQKLHDAKTQLAAAKADLLRESKSLQEFKENQAGIDVQIAKAEATDDPVALKAAKDKRRTTKTLEDGALANIKTFKSKIALLTETVDSLEANAVERLHENALQSQKQLGTLESDALQVKKDLAKSQAKESELAQAPAER